MSNRTNDTTSAIVDSILKFVATGGLLTTALIAPNAVQIFDKPLVKLLNELDERQRNRELSRVVHYMKNRGLISYNPKDYDHGIQITKAGKQRLKRSSYSDLSIAVPLRWDKKWRAVFFDIPEIERTKRNALNIKLRQLGFKQLQYSIWVHPFPCRSEIEFICEVLKIRRYVSYVELVHIDSEDLLKKRFKHLIK